MSWIGRRLDHIGSAAAGGVGGLSLSQAPAFTNAYLQRLGGHIDEAQRTVERLRSGEILPWLGPEGREQAVTELSMRLEQLEQLRRDLLEAPALLRPLALLQHADWSIAKSAAEAFVPAVPLSPAALTWTLIGVVVAALCYDCLKIPAWTARRVRERRAAATAQRSPKPRRTSGKGRSRGEDAAARKASATRTER